MLNRLAEDGNIPGNLLTGDVFFYCDCLSGQQDTGGHVEKLIRLQEWPFSDYVLSISREIAFWAFLKSLLNSFGKS